MPPPSYTEATDTSCIEPPVVVPVVSPDENEAPPSYEEAIEDSQHSISDVEMSERQPGWWFLYKNKPEWLEKSSTICYMICCNSSFFGVYCKGISVHHQ